MSGHVHVIPVDPTISRVDAWRELCIFGRRVTQTGEAKWAAVDCDGDECHNLEPSQGVAGRHSPDVR